MSEGALNLVGVVGEGEKFVDGVIEADDGGFATGAENGVRDEDAGFLHGGKKRSDAGAGFHEDDERERVGADVEVRDFLRDSAVGELKIFCVEAGDDFVFGVADGDGSVDEDDAGFEGGVDTLGSLLDGDVRAGDHGAVGGLGEGGGRGKKDQKPEKSRPELRETSRHMGCTLVWATGAQTKVYATKGGSHCT